MIIQQQESRRPVTNIIENHDPDYQILRNPILSQRLSRHNAIQHAAFQHACHISPRPLFIFVERRVDDAICLAKLLMLELINSSEVRHFHEISEPAAQIFLASGVTNPPRRRGLRASNLFLCIFLLFAVRIVASLEAVCMRTEKYYVRAPEDPLQGRR